MASIFSRAFTTSLMVGRSLCSFSIHASMIRANREAATGGYSPLSFGSIRLASSLASDERWVLANCAKWRSTHGRSGSNTFRPVSICNNTIPNAYTSVFASRWPDWSRIHSLVLNEGKKHVICYISCINMYICVVRTSGDALGVQISRCAQDMRCDTAPLTGPALQWQWPTQAG